MRVEAHVFAIRIVADIVVASTDELGVNGWGEALLGLECSTNHWLNLSDFRAGFDTDAKTYDNVHGGTLF